MATPKTKANIGAYLIVSFLIVLATGIVLHLKKHGLLIEPRYVIKIVHWVAGFAMVALATVHFVQFRKMLSGMKKKFLWFWIDTWAVVVFGLITFITGAVKLLSPVKIPHLGQHHYVAGILMAVVILLHLVRGLPSWNRLRKIH